MTADKLTICELPWRDMESAPRDGTIFAVWCRGWNRPDGEPRIQFAQWLGGKLCAPWNYDSRPFANGWLPIEELNALAKVRTPHHPDEGGAGMSAAEIANGETVHLFADGTYRVSAGTDAAIDMTHSDYVRSFSIGNLLARLDQVAGMAHLALTRTDRKLILTEYREVLGLIRSASAVFVRKPEPEPPAPHHPGSTIMTEEIK